MRLYFRLTNRLERRGLGRAIAQTPREHAARLRMKGFTAAAEFSELTEIYYASRYGGDRAPPGAQQDRARLLADSILTELRRKQLVVI